jgi:spermidine synthase
MTKPSSKNFWFTDAEVPLTESGVKVDLLAKEILHQERSPFQEIQVLETADFGKALTLDGLMQTTERDEFIYHETIALMPCLLVKDPENVLIIGGGDGGALREVLRIKSVKKAIMAEIDERVVRVSEEFLPTLSAGAFKNPKSELVFGDGMKLVKKYNGELDVVILDLSDPFPDSPSEQLYKAPFFEDIKKALKSDGIVSIQSESLFLSKVWVENLVKELKQVFPFVTIHLIQVPTYASWFFCIITASNENLEDIDMDEFKKRYANVSGEIKYLSPEVYFASKAVPPFLRVG